MSLILPQVQTLSSVCLHQRVTVIGRARIDAYEQTVNRTKVTLELVDSSDCIELVSFLGDGKNFGLKINNIRQGEIIKVTNAVVVENQAKNVAIYPFNPLRLQLTEATRIERLASHPGVPDLPQETVPRLDVEVFSVMHEGADFIQLTVADAERREWILSLAGPLYRQWKQRAPQVNARPTLVLHRLRYGDDGELKLNPWSTIRFGPTSTWSSVNSSVDETNINTKKRKRSESDSSEDEVEQTPKKLKLDSSDDMSLSDVGISSEMDEIVRDAIAEVSTDALQLFPESCFPVATCTTTTSEKPQLEAPLAEEENEAIVPMTMDHDDMTLENTQLSSKVTPLSERTSEFWELPKDHVLLITSACHFDQITQRSSLHRPTKSSFWTYLGALSCIIAVGLFYFVVHDKLIIFLSLANFLKFT